MLLAPRAVAQSEAERELSPRQAFQTAMRELTKEAREAKSSFVLPRQRADFAAHFDHELDRELLASKFVHAMDRDPFIDAYIRWQLTSFFEELPAMDDEAFEKFLSELPACVPNPQASEEYVQPLMRASEAGELAPSDQKYVEKLIARLGEQREQAGVMRRPAESLRQWIAERVGEEGHRPIQASLEQCAALAEAGWDLDRIKNTITEQCEASFRDRSFSEEQRDRVARQAEALAKYNALRINSAYLDDGSLIVRADPVGVYDYEVRKWARTIRRQ